MTTDSNKSRIRTLKFDSHPTRTLRVSLHFTSTPHQLAFRVRTKLDGERFAVMNAEKIVSLYHVAIGANAALLRAHHHRDPSHLLQKQSQLENDEKDEDQTTNKKRKRGLAMETILCCGGSTHVGNVLSEYAFDDGSPSSPSLKTGNQIAVLFLGFDCPNDDEFCFNLHQVGLFDDNISKGGDEVVGEDIENYFGRTRTQEEIKNLIRTYKTTIQEIEMNGSSLEQAVITRIATKYIV